MNDFNDYAMNRMERSGVIVDKLFTQFIYDEYCDKTSKPGPDRPQEKKRRINISKLDHHKYFLCYGNKDIFWLLEVSKVEDWKESNNSRNNIPIHKPNKGNFFELDDSLQAEVFTPIPEGYYTAHESATWLNNNPDIYNHLLQIVGK